MAIQWAFDLAITKGVHPSSFLRFGHVNYKLFGKKTLYFICPSVYLELFSGTEEEIHRLPELYIRLHTDGYRILSWKTLERSEQYGGDPTDDYIQFNYSRKRELWRPMIKL
jgi:hypothetical protein